MKRRWSCQLTEIERLTVLPGNHAWLTVIDDLGSGARPVSRWRTPGTR